MRLLCSVCNRDVYYTCSVCRSQVKPPPGVQRFRCPGPKGQRCYNIIDVNATDAEREIYASGRIAQTSGGRKTTGAAVATPLSVPGQLWSSYTCLPSVRSLFPSFVLSFLRSFLPLFFCFHNPRINPIPQGGRVLKTKR